MKRTVTEYEFTQAFVDCNRAENFSYEGRKALFDWFEQLEEDCGEEIEFDPIGICCEFSEYECALEAANDYPDFNPDPSENKEEQALEYLRDNTLVIEHDTGIIIQSF
jgi:hypothetical protein